MVISKPYCASLGHPKTYSRNDLSIVENEGGICFMKKAYFSPII